VSASADGRAPFDTWAVIELFGHQRIAGHVTEEVIGSATMIRVDVPATGGDRPGYTKYLGNGAIYGMTPTTEEIATRAARSIERYKEPVAYLPPSHQLAAPVAADIVHDDSDEDENVWGDDE
jgi:hypothetical protein